MFYASCDASFGDGAACFDVSSCRYYPMQRSVDYSTKHCAASLALFILRDRIAQAFASRLLFLLEPLAVGTGLLPVAA